MPDADDPGRGQQNPANVRTQGPGQSVGVDAVETSELELVTTQQLQTILASADDVSRRSIEDAAASGNDGVLVRNAVTGLFKIVDDSIIQPLLNEGRKQAQDSENLVSTGDRAATPELSLVDTQILRTVMDAESDTEAMPDDTGSGGFDPYNSS